MSEHLDLDQLADLLAGDDAHRAHLAGCEQCRTHLSRLEAALPSVANALAGLPPAAEPDDLAARLTRDLRLAPAADLQQRRASKWTRPLAAVSGVAAAAALVVGGIAVLGGEGAKDGNQPTASVESATKTSSTGLSYGKDGALLAQQLPALLAGNATAQDSAKAPEVDVLSTQEAAPGSAAGGTRGSADALARLRTTEGLAACIAALTEPGQVLLPLALDYAAFEGSPALVVVLPSSKADKVDVFIVGSSCAVADAGLLYFGRISKT